MNEELARSIEQLSNVGRFDFARSGRPVSRGNSSQRITFSRYVPHENIGASWYACAVAINADPWGEKSYLSITPRNGFGFVYLAALLSSSHQPVSTGPGPESVHEYNFRVQPVSAVTLPGGLIIIGGYFNPPVGYYIPPLPPGVSIPPGSGLGFTGTPGLPSGGYTVGGTGIAPGGSGEIEISPDEEPQAVENISPPSISSGNNYPGTNVLRTAGSWSNATSITGQWYFKGAATGNTSSSFIIPFDADENDAIFYRETASNTLGNASEDSNTLLVDELPFINISPPTISSDGETATATIGVWQSADTVTGLWYRNGAPLTGEISLTYIIPDDVADGDEFFYRETATKAGKPNQTASSNVYTFTEYDASPMIVPGVDMWVEFDGSPGSPEYHIGRRNVIIDIEWRGFPVGYEIDAIGNNGSTTTTIISDSDATASSYSEFQALVSPGTLDHTDSVFSGDLTGKDFTTAEVGEIFEDKVIGDQGVQYVHSGIGSSYGIRVRNDSDVQVFSFLFLPNYQITYRLRSSAGDAPDYTSGRSIRLTYEDGEILVQMPEGFTQSPF